MSRVSAWFTALVLLLVAGIASLLSDNIMMALACIVLALCMGALGARERKRNPRQ